MHTEFDWDASTLTATATSPGGVGRVRHPRPQRRGPPPGGLGRAPPPRPRRGPPPPHASPKDVPAEPVRVLVERRRHRLQRVAGADDERGVDRLLVGGLTLADLVDPVLVHPGDEET